MKITIHRKKRFASALCPYWVVTGISRDDFIRRLHGCEGNTITFEYLDEQGARIKNGQTITLDLNRDGIAIFVVSRNGTFSHEVRSNPKSDSLYCEIDTKGGWSDLPYPCLSAYE